MSAVAGSNVAKWEVRCRILKKEIHIGKFSNKA